MATNKEIYDFAMRWSKKYRSSETKEYEVEEGFADECFALGFEMDCGNAFETEFPGTNAFSDYEALDKIIGQVQDVSLLGSAIFSKWRYITHWSFGEQLLSPQNRPWFILAFGRLASLTSEDRVEKITINYHRITKIEQGIPISDSVKYYIWDYSENLVIDRETETLEHTQRVGSGCMISRKYYVQGGVADLLDGLDADSLFEHIAGNSSDTITDPLETKDYEIIVDFQKRRRLVIKGTFDKHGLPSDFPEFAEDILDFMWSYGIGEILEPSVYKQAKRRANDYIFCSVEFSEDGKSYYYLTEDDTLEIGDYVLVPVGKRDARTAIVEIVNIEYFSEDEVPFPIDKVKSIIKKHTKDELNPSNLDDIK